ncbi:MAG: DUF6644 family protein [Polyangiaceae bacterium]|jgi:hypothetical protein
MSYPHSLDDFCSWLKVTPLSLEIQTVGWVIPTLQTIHIVAIAAVISAALMVTLRTLGLTARDQPWTAVAGRFLPVIWRALPILLCTGLLLITAEPARSIKNPAFLLKMVLLLLAITVTGVWRTTASLAAGFWEASAARKRTAKLLAVVFISLWAGVIVAGRFIAYVQAS